MIAASSAPGVSRARRRAADRTVRSYGSLAPARRTGARGSRVSRIRCSVRRGFAQAGRPFALRFARDDRLAAHVGGGPLSSVHITASLVLGCRFLYSVVGRHSAGPWRRSSRTGSDAPAGTSAVALARVRCWLPRPPPRAWHAVYSAAWLANVTVPARAVGRPCHRRSVGRAVHTCDRSSLPQRVAAGWWRSAPPPQRSPGRHT